MTASKTRAEGMTTDPKPAWDAPLTARQAAIKRAVDSAPVIEPGSDQALELQSLFAGLPAFVRERRAAEKRAGREAA